MNTLVYISSVKTLCFESLLQEQVEDKADQKRSQNFVRWQGLYTVH